MNDYLPHRDIELAGWATQFAKHINATPGSPGSPGSPESYGLTETQAMQYLEVQQDYVEALTIAMQPDTRTAPAIEHKNATRKTLIERSRQFVGIVQAHPGTTDAMRVLLQITTRKKRRRAVAKTTQRPRMRLINTAGHRVTFEVVPTEGSPQARPKGVRGYTWFYAVGEKCPGMLSGWTFGGNELELTKEVVLSTALEPGTRVWFIANWFNNRLQPGPESEPTMARVGWSLTDAGPVEANANECLGIAA